MIQHTAKDRTPFTYYFKWTKQNIAYYGCRYGQRCHPSQLGVSYMSSSKYVEEHIKNYGAPDIIRVTRIFDSVEKCINWEARFLIKTKAKYNPLLLNRAEPNAYGKSIFKPSKPPTNISIVGLTERIVTETGKYLNIENDLGKSRYLKFCVSYKSLFTIRFATSEERNDFLKNNKDWKSGNYKVNTEETLLKISKSMSGVKKKPRTKEHTENQRNAQMGCKKPNSGPRKPKDYYEKIESKKRLALDKKRLRHKEILYFLNMTTRVSLFDPLYNEYISQGWSIIKQKEDYDFIKKLNSEHLSRLYKGKPKPKVMTEELSKNISDGAKRGHITRKLKKLNQVAL